MVYVQNIYGRPLMPTRHYGKVKHMLRDGRAKVVHKEPFTIRLLYETTEYTQPVTAGIDTGSGTFGAAAVADDTHEVLYQSSVEVRNDIKTKMTRRADYRRIRRNRKTRYRKARFNNRKNSIKTDRFSPTMVSKINAHCREIEFIKSILPVTKLVFETGVFDPYLLKCPELADKEYARWGYQHGPNYGYANTKAMVKARDGYKCVLCKGKSKDKHLHVHHVVFRSEDGSDEESNLVTLCKTCHDKLHHGEIEYKAKGKHKGTLLYATQMNSIRVQLLRIYPEAIETFGYVTSENCQLYGLPKEHYVDAAVIASGIHKPVFVDNILYLKKCVAKGDYQQRKGVRSEKSIPICKIAGFRKFDKVMYNGIECFIKGRMSASKTAILCDITGKKIDFPHVPKLADMERVAARGCQMCIVQKTDLTEHFASSPGMVSDDIVKQCIESQSFK